MFSQQFNDVSHCLLAWIISNQKSEISLNVVPL